MRVSNPFSSSTIYGNRRQAVARHFFQGSVLEPLLFLIYINDLTNVVVNPSSVINMFADDVLLYYVISCPNDYLYAHNQLQPSKLVFV